VEVSAGAGVEGSTAGLATEVEKVSAGAGVEASTAGLATEVGDTVGVASTVGLVDEVVVAVVALGVDVSGKVALVTELDDVATKVSVVEVEVEVALVLGIIISEGVAVGIETGAGVAITEFAVVLATLAQLPCTLFQSPFLIVTHHTAPLT